MRGSKLSSSIQHGNHHHDLSKASRERARYRECRTYAAVALIIIFVFWASYSAQCIISHTSSHPSGNIPLDSHLCSGDGSLDPRCRLRRGERINNNSLLASRIDPGLLYTNLAEYQERKAHLEDLVRDIGYFHTVPFDAACNNCSEADSVLLSHLRLLWRISQEFHDRYVLIFEDIAELAQQLRRESFTSVLDAEMRHVLQQTDDFVYLGVCLTPDMESSCTARSCSPFGLHAYMVTPRGARKIFRALEGSHGKFSVDSYVGKAINLNQVIGTAPTLGWNYTHNHVMGGWRGLFYQARTSAWRLPTINTSATLKVSISHKPKNDLLGSFVTPTILLAAVAQYNGWTLEILPYAGSESEKTLLENFALGDKIDSTWGTGFKDASNREGYNPAALNTASYDTMGFFPPVTTVMKEWLPMEFIPEAGAELYDECRKHNSTHRNNNECNIMLPDTPFPMEEYMKKHGGFDTFFTSEFRESKRTIFLQTNNDRLKHYQGDQGGGVGGYHVAMHVRRGDILDPQRWIDQDVFAKLARLVCKTHPEAHIHVFSAGKNRDGNWTTLEGVTEGESKCAQVSFHLDELEFDTWAHMVAADVLVMSKSNFGLIPSLLSGGEVYYPSDYWHIRLSSFRLFDSKTGEIVNG